MELNKKEIIEVLERCRVVCDSGNITFCEECLLYEKKCSVLLPNYALSLIKELTEKIDDLEYRLEVQGDNLGITREWLNDAECKVEKLTAENEDLNAIAEQYRKLFEEARADTVREFAERVKDCFCPDADYSGYDIKRVIEQIANDMGK